VLSTHTHTYVYTHIHTHMHNARVTTLMDMVTFAIKAAKK
jgi:hypothetical protein